MTEKTESGLTAAEDAYFETGGAAPLETEQKPAEPEAKVEDQPAEPQGDKPAERDDKGRFVPHGALHAEREEHKKTRAELDELKQFRARMEERIRIAEQARQQPEQKDPYADEPDPEQNPVGWMTWRRELDRQERAQRQQQDAQSREAQEAENTFRQHYNYVRDNFEDAGKADPEFTDAYNSAVNSIRQELSGMGYRGDQFAAAEGQMLRSLVFNASAALQRGVSAAEFVKAVAGARGWRPKPAEQKPADGKVTLPDELRKVAEAQDASRTVGQAPGRAGGEELGLDQIVAMDATTFTKWYADPKNAARFDRLLGGR